MSIKAGIANLVLKSAEFVFFSLTNFSIDKTRDNNLCVVGLGRNDGYIVCRFDLLFASLFNFKPEHDKFISDSLQLSFLLVLEFADQVNRSQFNSKSRCLDLFH